MKALLYTSASVVVVVVSLVATLGKNFGPWFKTGKDSIAEKLIDLVGKHEFQLNSVIAKIAEYKSQIVEQAQQRVMLQSLVGRVDERLASARCTISEHRGQMHTIRRKLVAGDTVLTSTGASMSNEQVQSSIQHSERVIDMAVSREKSLSQLLEICQSRLNHLTLACEQAPQRLRELHDYCRDLQDKIAVAKDMQSWTNELGEIGTTDPAFDDLRGELTSISDRIDGQLAGLSALMSIRHSASDVAPATDDLIARITRSLDDTPSDRELARAN